MPNSNKSTTHNISIRGIIFDMDGTLTLPVLDFKGLTDKLGIDSSVDILEYASRHPPDRQDHIYKMIADWEAEGIANMKLRPYLHQLLYFLKEEQLNVALLTRNNRTSVDAFINKFIADDTKGVFKQESDIFSLVLTRDFTPVKPHPAPVNHICSKWDISEESVILVGDDVQDIECGKNAGTVTTLVNKATNEEVKKLADFNIDALSELVELLKSNFIIDRTSKNE